MNEYSPERIEQAAAHVRNGKKVIEEATAILETLPPEAVETRDAIWTQIMAAVIRLDREARIAGLSLSDLPGLNLAHVPERLN